MRGRLFHALIFLSFSQSSESDKTDKKRLHRRGRRNVKPGIFTARPRPRPHQFYFLPGREQKYFSMTASPGHTLYVAKVNLSCFLSRIRGSGLHSSTLTGAACNTSLTILNILISFLVFLEGFATYS